MEKDWNAEVKGILKAEITRRHLTYRDVVEKLDAMGTKETEGGIYATRLAGGDSRRHSSCKRWSRLGLIPYGFMSQTKLEYRL